jgi:hypothetical protein
MHKMSTEGDEIKSHKNADPVEPPRRIHEIFSSLEQFTGQRIPFKENKGLLTEHEPFSSGGIGHSQLNELLLTLGYDRVSTPFFEYCFGAGSVDSYESFQKGVEKFRTHAILLYGNVKFAFKTLSPLDEMQLADALTNVQPVKIEHYSISSFTRWPNSGRMCSFCQKADGVFGAWGYEAGLNRALCYTSATEKVNHEILYVRDRG